MEVDEAIALLIELLQNGQARNYGYDLFPRRGADEAAARLYPREQFREQRIGELSPVFYEAAWELCRRGIVRPGVTSSGAQAVEEGGYSLTVAGRAALPNLDAASLLIAQPGALAAALAGFRGRFGDGFHQQCRNAEAWLACCAMVGAAAESILLALAIEKEGDEAKVLKAYGQAGGRRKVLNMVVGQADPARRDTLTTFAGIVSLWRDEAAHGAASPLSTANADESLRQLLHMCQWVNREWANLTA
jgi:hypothetical protein